MGSNGLGSAVTDNGTRLIDLATSLDLLIGGTLFEHKDIHKYTWTHPNLSSRAQIDHILVSRKYRNWIQDVRTFRGADIATDHELLIANLRLAMRKLTQPQQAAKTWDVEKLNIQKTKTEFQVKVFNRFEKLLSVRHAGVEEKVNFIVSTFDDAAADTIGKRNPKRPRWMSNPTWTLIDKRKHIKQLRDSASSMIQKQHFAIQYNELDKDVKRSARNDKRSDLDRKIQFAECAVKKNDTRHLYRLTKEISGASFRSSGSICDRNGNRLSTKLDVLARWREHFEEILNRPAPESIVDLDEVSGRFHFPKADGFVDDPPTHKEVETAQSNEMWKKCWSRWYSN